MIIPASQAIPATPPPPVLEPVCLAEECREEKKGDDEASGRKAKIQKKE
jgi:hypothetical protein